MNEERAVPQYRHVYFRPWIGTEYEGEGLWGRRVLIVGESHYDEWADLPIEGRPPPLVTKHELPQTFTEECIRDVASGEGGARFWTLVRLRLGGAEYDRQQPSIFWSKVAFYDFIQSAVEGGPGSRPTPVQWQAAAMPFREALETLRPDRVLFTGRQLWEHVPARDDKLPDIEYEGHKLPLEVFTLNDRKTVFVTATGHPRSRYFIRGLTPMLREFVVRDWGKSSN
jgi:hypothetical protein